MATATIQPFRNEPFADFSIPEIRHAMEAALAKAFAAQGWKIDTVKPGDKITVEGHPLKDGTRGGQYDSAKLPDGRQRSQLFPTATDRI